MDECPNRRFQFSLWHEGLRALLRNRSKTAGNMARYAFVALCLLFAQTWQRWRTIWARCGTGWAPLMFNLSPR